MKKLMRKWLTSLNFSPEKPIVFFGGALLAVFIYAFYATPIKSSIENILQDYKTSFFDVSSERSHEKVVTIVPLQKEDSTYIEETSNKVKAKPAVKLIEEVLKYSPHKVVFFLYPSILDPMSRRFEYFSELTKKHPNLYYATLDINKNTQRSLDLKKILPNTGNFLSADTHRIREQPLREMPLFGFLGYKKTLLLPSFLALGYLGGEPKIKNLNKLGFTQKDLHNRSFLLNYTRLNHFNTVLPNNLSNNIADIKDKIVLIAPDFFKYRVSTEHLYVQTPFQKRSEIAENGFGEPLVNIQALAIDNLIHNKYLKESSYEDVISVVQVLAILVIFILTIKNGLPVFLVCLIFFWALLFIVHINATVHFNTIYPMSNAALFSFLCAFIGGVYKTTLDNKNKILEEIKKSSSAQSSSLRSLFLKRFSQTLSSFNGKILDSLSEITVEKPSYIKIKKKLVESSEGFKVYLDTIEQFASLTESDTRFLQKTRILLFPFLKNIINKFSLSLQSSDIKIVINCKKHWLIKSDITFLEPIIFNLISNAIKYSPKGSKITVDVSKNLFGKTTFKVIDQGAGIEKKYQEKIFEKFFRITGEHSVNVKGTGLGLFLCKFFTERLKGKLSVRSDLGKGSTFILKV